MKITDRTEFAGALVDAGCPKHMVKAIELTLFEAESPTSVEAALTALRRVLAEPQTVTDINDTAFFCDGEVLTMYLGDTVVKMPVSVAREFAALIPFAMGEGVKLQSESPSGAPDAEPRCVCCGLDETNCGRPDYCCGGCRALHAAQPDATPEPHSEQQAEDAALAAKISGLATQHGVDWVCASIIYLQGVQDGRAEAQAEREQMREKIQAEYDKQKQESMTVKPGAPMYGFGCLMKSDALEWVLSVMYGETK